MQRESEMEAVWFSPGVLFSGFSVEVEAGLPFAVRAIERNFGVPIAGHIDLDFGAIPTWRIRPFDCRAGMHLHPRHVHVHVELDVCNINELALRVSEFNEEFVVAAAKWALRMNEIDRQVVDGLSCERSA